MKRLREPPPQWTNGLVEFDHKIYQALEFYNMGNNGEIKNEFNESVLLDKQDVQHWGKLREEQKKECQELVETLPEIMSDGIFKINYKHHPNLKLNTHTCYSTTSIGVFDEGGKSCDKQIGHGLFAKESIKSGTIFPFTGFMTNILHAKNIKATNIDAMRELYDWDVPHEIYLESDFFLEEKWREYSSDKSELWTENFDWYLEWVRDWYPGNGLLLVNDPGGKVLQDAIDKDLIREIQKAIIQEIIQDATPKPQKPNVTVHTNESLVPLGANLRVGKYFYTPSDTYKDSKDLPAPLGFPFLVAIATRDIHQGEELMFPYGLNYKWDVAHSQDLISNEQTVNASNLYDQYAKGTKGTSYPFNHTIEAMQKVFPGQFKDGISLQQCSEPDMCNRPQYVRPILGVVVVSLKTQRKFNEHAFALIVHPQYCNNGSPKFFIVPCSKAMYGNFDSRLKYLSEEIDRNMRSRSFNWQEECKLEPNGNNEIAGSPGEGDIIIRDDIAKECIYAMETSMKMFKEKETEDYRESPESIIRVQEATYSRQHFCHKVLASGKVCWAAWPSNQSGRLHQASVHQERALNSNIKLRLADNIESMTKCLELAGIQ